MEAATTIHSSPGSLRLHRSFGTFLAMCSSLLLLLPSFLAAQQMPGGMQPQGPPPLPHPEIAPPPELPAHVSAFAVIAILVVVGLLVSGVILLLFGRKGTVGVATKRPVRDALRALKDLRNKVDVLSASEVGHQVSEILRRFYEARYGIPAPFRTTQELFPKVEPTQEPMRRRMWRERYEPLAAIYDQLSYAPVPGTTVEAARLVDDAIHKLEDERLNEDPRAS